MLYCISYFILFHINPLCDESIKSGENTPQSCHHSKIIYRADSRFAPSQWETALHCKDVSHWLGASLESTLINIGGLLTISIFIQNTLIFSPIFSSYTISLHWVGTGRLEPSWWKTRTCLFYIVNIVAVDDLQKQGARASAAKLLTQFLWNILASACGGVN